MMLRFARFMIRLWLAVVALIVGSMAVGRVAGKPNEVQAFGFEVCEGKLCLLGLRPQMSWAEAKALLKNRSNLLAATEREMVIQQGQYGRARIISKTAGINSKAIDYMEFTTSSNDLRLGDFIAFYGVPCRVAVTTDSIFGTLQPRNIVSLIYPNAGLLIAQSGGRISMESPIYQIFLDGTNACQDATKELTRLYVGRSVIVFSRSWLGFTSLDSHLPTREWWR